jgi:hypothetical protein
MIHHEGEKQVSKQAKQMGHHYLQMGGAHCTTSSYPVPKFLDLIIGSPLLPLEDFLSSYIFYISPFLLAAGKSATIYHLGVE